MRDDFAVLILTHGRPDKVKTLRSLEMSGYTGKIYLVIDNEDATAERYIENFGKEKVIVFDKEAEAKRTDEADLMTDRRTITYARNVSFQVARDLGLKYFIQLDDDFTGFYYRYDHNDKWALLKRILSIGDVFGAMLNFHEQTPFLAIAMAQGCEFIGGEENIFGFEPIRIRKAMNSFICSVERPFRFIGRMNEDVNTYTTLGSRGFLFLTIVRLMLAQMQTQASPGGITELYKSAGTYQKSFYTVMVMPSAVKIGMIGTAGRRIHHNISWKNTVPMIISGRYKKTQNAL